MSIKVPTTQPKSKAHGVNWNNPITEGLIFLMDPHQEGVNLVDGVVPTKSNGATFKDSGSYFAFQGELNGSEVLDYGNRYDGMPTLTVLALAKNRKDAIAATGLESIIGKSGSGDDPYQVLWGQDENYHFSVDTTDNNTSDAISDIIVDGLSAGQTPADQWNVLGGTYDGSTVLARINKVKGSGSVATGSVAPETLNTFTIGLGGTATWDGWIATGAVWERALSDDEWNSLVDNPWQLFLVEEGPEEPVITFRKSCTEQPSRYTPVDYANDFVQRASEIYTFEHTGDPNGAFIIYNKSARAYRNGVTPGNTTYTLRPENSGTVDFQGIVGGSGKGSAIRMNCGGVASATNYTYLRGGANHITYACGVNSNAEYDNLGVTGLSILVRLRSKFDPVLDGVNPATGTASDAMGIYSSRKAGLKWDGNAATSMRWQYGNGDAINTYITADAGGIIKGGVWHTLLISCDWGNSRVTSWLDGVLQAVDTGMTAPSAVTEDWLMLFVIHSTTARPFPGDIELAMVFPEYLTDGEAASLSGNPYQIFKPETIMVPAGDAAKRRLVVF